MTLGELERAMASKRRIEKSRIKEKASFDYILAELIGRSVARIYSKDSKFPEIYDAYPSLFEKEVMEVQEKDTIDFIKESLIKKEEKNSI